MADSSEGRVTAAPQEGTEKPCASVSDSWAILPPGRSAMDHVERPTEDDVADLDRQPTWQNEMKRAFRNAVDLCRYLDLAPSLAGQSLGPSHDFGLFAPYPYVDRIRRGDPTDPLLRQILPLADEHHVAAGFSVDPVADLAAQALPGVIRKYAGRALLVTSGACAIHCRYCFRRHFPYAERCIP